MKKLTYILILVILTASCESDNPLSEPSQNYDNTPSGPSQTYTYSLTDINPASTSYGEVINPANYQGQVTLHYFGKQT